MTGDINPLFEVIEKSSKVVSSFPKETVECLRYIIEGNEKEYFVIIYEKQISEILKTAMNSNSSKDAASKLINHLISKGYTSFYNIL